MTGGRWAYDAFPDRPRGSWPNGARLALVVCVGIESYRFGEGLTEDVLPGTPVPDLVNTAWRDYGNRVGAFRLLDGLQRLAIRPTVLLNTDAYDEAPAVLAAARAVGAEIVGHGRSNSDSLATMTAVEEAAYLESVASRIGAEEGARPGGWSSPWLAHTDRTIDLLAATGYRYLLDLRLDDQPVWLRTSGDPLLAIPYAAELNDSSTMIGRQASASEFADMVLDEAAELHEAAAERPLVLSVVLHSFITGAPFRLRRVLAALEQVAALPGVWSATPAELHRAVVESPDLFGSAPVEEAQR